MYKQIWGLLHVFPSSLKAHYNRIDYSPESQIKNTLNMTTSYLVYVMIEVFLQQMACHWKSDWEFKIKEYIFYFIRRIFFMISLNLVSTSLCPVKCVCTAATVKDCPRHLKNTRNLSSFWFLLGIFWCFYIYIFLIFQKNKEMLWSKHFAIQRRKLNKNHESSSFPCKLQFAIPTTESCGFGFLTVMLEVQL